MAKRKRELMAWATVSLLTGYVRIESNRRRLTTRTGSLIGPFRINLKRYELAHVDPVMRIDAPWTCGDCRHHRRCSALIGSLRPDAAFCDFAPSRFALDTIGVLVRWLAESDPVLDAQKRLVLERCKGA